jgi:hypothetical protein
MSDMKNYREEYREMGVRRGEMTRVSFINQVYGWMCGGLVLTAIAAWAVISSEALQRAILANKGIFLILILAEFGLVMAISWGINRMSAATAGALFIVYSLLNGLTISVILFAYTSASVSTTFLIAAGMFGAMSIYGVVTKRDLTSLGGLMLMGLIGIIIASVVNIFLGSSSLEWAISILGVFIFLGLTAYDSQKIMNMSSSMDASDDRESVGKMAIIGALALYLDFINLFLFLLRIFGNRR